MILMAASSRHEDATVIANHAIAEPSVASSHHASPKHWQNNYNGQTSLVAAVLKDFMQQNMQPDYPATDDDSPREGGLVAKARLIQKVRENVHAKQSIKFPRFFLQRWRLRVASYMGSE